MKSTQPDLMLAGHVFSLAWNLACAAFNSTIKNLGNSLLDGLENKFHDICNLFSSSKQINPTLQSFLALRLVTTRS